MKFEGPSGFVYAVVQDAVASPAVADGATGVKVAEVQPPVELGRSVNATVPVGSCEAPATPVTVTEYVTGWPTAGAAVDGVTDTVLGSVAAPAVTAVAVSTLAARTRQTSIGLPIHLIIELPFMSQTFRS